MKQSKRLLSVLLAMVMVFSMFTVGVSAYKTSYEEPAGYDSILTPYFTNDQAATALLDFLDDEVFAGMDVHESILGIDINIVSFDTLCDSLENIMGSTLYGIATILNLGDIEELNVKALRDSSNRRRNPNQSDFQLFLNVCNCLSLDDNADVIAGIVDGSFTLGLIDNFFDLYDEVPMLKNLHGFLCNMLYELLITDGVETGYQEGAADSYNLDQILQTFLNDKLISFIFNLLDQDAIDTVMGFVALPFEFDGEGKITNDVGLINDRLFPSLTPSSINIRTTSTYDFIINLVNALVDDVVIPYAGALILDLLEIAPDDYDNTDASYIDIAINLFVDYNTLVEAGAVSADTPEDEVNIIEEFLRWKGVENPERPKPIDKINVALEYVIKVGLKKFIWFEPTSVGSHLQLTEYFQGMFTDLVKSIVPMLPSFTSDFTPLTPEEEAAVNDMEYEELFAFLLKMILEAFVDGVYFPDGCNSIKELATYTMVNMCEELVHSPNADFQKMIDQGALDPDSMQCLDVAAAVINYYLVGGTTFESATLTPTFVQLANNCFETFLGKYVTLFSMYPNASDRQTYANDPWYKVYMSVNQWIPLTNIFYGVEDSKEGLEDLLMNSIIGNVLNFDLNGFLGIIGRRNDSDLNKPFSKLVANLLARILNGVFKLPTEETNQSTNDFQLNRLIVPYDYTELDQVVKTYNSGGTINNTGLYNTARMLMKSLPNICQDGAVAKESLDVICTLAGILDLDEFGLIRRQYANTFSGSYSMNQLKSLYNELKIPSNDGIKYYEDNYTYSDYVDYAYWTYDDFKDALEDAENLINAFDKGESVKRADITYAYYYLDHVYHDYLLANQPAANDFYLLKVMNNNPRITSNTAGDGTQLYTSRSWDAYVKAYDFAQKVVGEYNAAELAGNLGDYPQSKVNMARAQLRDAVNGLTEKAGLADADYSGLITAINSLAYLDSPSLFTDKSVQNVVDMYNQALAFSREVPYDSDGQAIIDGYTERLNKAYNALVTIPILSYYDPDETYFCKDEVKSYIYGLVEPLFTAEQEEEFGDFTTYMDFWMASYGTNGCADLQLISTELGNGTGSRIQLRSDEDGDGYYITEREYTVIYFGDVNGDGLADGMDAVILRCFASRLLDSNANNTAITYAGDVDCDDRLTTNDANTIINSGVFKAEIDQAPAARAESQIAFADIVNA